MITVGRPATVIVSGCPPLRDSSTRAPYFSFLSVSNIRKHLAAEKLHALAGQLVWQRPGLTAGQYDAGPEFLAVMVQLLPHRFGAADNGKHPLPGVIPAPP